MKFLFLEINCWKTVVCGLNEAQINFENFILKEEFFPMTVFTSLFVVKMKTFILFGINKVSSNFIVDNFFVSSCDPQKLLATYMFECLLVLTSIKSPVH